jgi:hypothetical protein
MQKTNKFMSTIEQIDLHKLAVDFQHSSAFEVAILGSKFSLEGSLIRNVAVNKMQRCVPRSRLSQTRA